MIVETHQWEETDYRYQSLELGNVRSWTDARGLKNKLKRLERSFILRKFNSLWEPLKLRISSKGVLISYLIPLFQLLAEYKQKQWLEKENGLTFITGNRKDFLKTHKNKQ